MFIVTVPGQTPPDWKGYRVYINPAIKYPNVCHSCVGRNPVEFWMPDQVRHDGGCLFNCRINMTAKVLDSEGPLYDQLKEKIAQSAGEAAAKMIQAAIKFDVDEVRNIISPL